MKERKDKAISSFSGFRLSCFRVLPVFLFSVDDNFHLDGPDLNDVVGIEDALLTGI